MQGRGWRIKMKVAGGVPAAVVQRLVDAIGHRTDVHLVPLDRGEVWDPFLVVIDPDHLDAAAALLHDPEGLDSRVVVAFEGASAISDSDYWSLRREGAADVLDLSTGLVASELAALCGRLTRWAAVDEIIASGRVADVLVGRTAIWLGQLRALVEAAIGGDQAVLIHGETGTGKEAAARLVHDVGRNGDGPFVIVDCASIMETLSGSELFGHKRGAFTGADRDRDGALLRANGGTLFLDEIGELKPTLQAELLRALQEGVWRAVGDDQPRRSKFRLVAATNRELEQMVRAGTFRSDLYYRIAATIVALPPLRARRDDVPLLLRHFLREALRAHGPVGVDDRLLRLVQSLPFDGNVRELRSLALTLACRYDGSGVVDGGHLPASMLGRTKRTRWSAEHLRNAVSEAVDAGETFRSIVDTCKDAACVAALRAGGSTRNAAQMLAVTTRMLEKRRGPQRSRDREDGVYDNEPEAGDGSVRGAAPPT